MNYYAYILRVEDNTTAFGEYVPMGSIVYDISNSKAYHTTTFLDVNETIDSAISQGHLIVLGNTGLEKITEGSKSGWRLSGRSSAYYGSIGQDAIDFSTSTVTSVDNGATGDYSFAAGKDVEASGVGSAVMSYQSKAQATLSLILGGIDHLIELGANASLILGGQNNHILPNVINTIILGGTDQIARLDNTVYLTIIKNNGLSQHDIDALSLNADDYGLLVYNKSTNKFIYWDGSAWKDIGAGSGTDELVAATSGGTAGYLNDVLVGGTYVSVTPSPDGEDLIVDLKGPISTSDEKVAYSADTNAGYLSQVLGIGDGLDADPPDISDPDAPLVISNPYTSIISLRDTPSDYGDEGQVLAVNKAQDGFEYVNLPAEQNLIIKQAVWTGNGSDTDFAIAVTDPLEILEVLTLTVGGALQHRIDASGNPDYQILPDRKTIRFNTAPDDGVEVILEYFHGLPTVQIGASTDYHNDLLGRDAADVHPRSSITGCNISGPINNFVALDGNGWITNSGYNHLSFAVSNHTHDVSLAILTDTALSNPQTNDFLVYNGNKWVNFDFISWFKLEELTDVYVSNPADDHILKYSTDVDGNGNPGWKNVATEPQYYYDQRENITINAVITDDPWDEIAALHLTDVQHGVYEFKFSVNWSTNRTNSSCFFRISTDGGTTWQEFSKEAKDTNDVNTLTYIMPIEIPDDATDDVNVIIQAARESSTNDMEVLKSALIMDGKM